MSEAALSVGMRAVELAARRWVELAMDVGPAGAPVVLGAGQVKETERFGVATGQYYRVRFKARGTARMKWAAVFYSPSGRELPWDHYWSLDLAAGELSVDACFKGKWDGSTAALRWTGEQGQLEVSRAEVQAMGLEEAHVWVRGAGRELGSVDGDWGEGDCQQGLAQVRRKLATGGELRFVLLGDSIANDLSNSPLDLFLQEQYPRARVELRFTGAGGTGLHKLSKEVVRRVVRHEPCLVVLLAISHQRAKDLHDGLLEIIGQVRTACPDSDLLMISPHIGRVGEDRFDGCAQREVMRKVTRETGVTMVNLIGAWGHHLEKAGRNIEWLLRDDVHMNDRGRILSGRIVGRVLGGDGVASTNAVGSKR